MVKTFASIFVVEVSREFTNKVRRAVDEPDCDLVAGGILARKQMTEGNNKQDENLSIKIYVTKFILRDIVT